MRRFSPVILAALCLTPLTGLFAQAPLPYRDLASDTWVATDAIERSLPTYADIGGIREEKTVGLFYFLWLGEHSKSGPWDISKILAKDPAALGQTDNPLWGPMSHFHHWGEPWFGYYVSDDEYVLRKHAQMLGDAGVDVIIFDVSNRATYQKPYRALFKVFSECRALGWKTPDVAFLCPFGPAGSAQVVNQLYEEIYKEGLGRDLWFEWEGKPLMMGYPDAIESEEIRDFFTFRAPRPDYRHGQNGENQWGWLDVYPQQVYENSGKVEQMTVGVGQNACDDADGTVRAPTGFQEPNARGRSYRSGDYPAPPDALLYGANFGEQWKRALEVDPEFLFITGWNEWVAMRFTEFAGVEAPVVFVDQIDEERSRDCEPARAGIGDNYYYQMIDGIRRFKGVRPVPTANGPHTIDIDGVFSDWESVRPEFRDQIGDPARRNHPGWGTAGPYVNTTGRNDIVAAKVADSGDTICFYAQTLDALTPAEDTDWMLLFIDVDMDHTTGWEGYDFVVNRERREDGTATVEATASGWNWKEVGTATYRATANEIEIAIPRKLLGVSKKGIDLGVKWADNTGVNGDISAFTINGDAAPNDRYNYQFRAPE